MTYDDFMHRLINLGIEAAKGDYTGAGELDADKLAGSIDGFMECRGKIPSEIAELLSSARKKGHEAFIRASENEISTKEYWRIRCWEIEIEWVANCVSVMMVNQGEEPIIPPTARAALTVAQIVGVRE